jgi:hypothetical protein
VSDASVMQISLSAADIWRLADGLDAREYWELGDVLPRNNGEVFIPGDLAPGSDRYWDGVLPTIEQHAAIVEAQACRALRERLIQAATAHRVGTPGVVVAGYATAAANLA